MPLAGWGADGDQGDIGRAADRSQPCSYQCQTRNDLYEIVAVEDESPACIRQLNQQAVEEGLLPEDYGEYQ